MKLKTNYTLEEKTNIRKCIELFVAIVILSIIMLLVGTLCFAEPLVDVDIIIQIESGGDPNAVGRYGEIGLMQISPIVLKEYLIYSDSMGVLYIKDLYDPYINITIGTWYLNTRIPQMLNFYKFADTIENRIRAYNWGIGKMIKHRDNLERMTPKTTINYIKKYKRLKGEK